MCKLGSVNILSLLEGSLQVLMGCKIVTHMQDFVLCCKNFFRWTLNSQFFTRKSLCVQLMLSIKMPRKFTKKFSVLLLGRNSTETVFNFISRSSLFWHYFDNKLLSLLYCRTKNLAYIDVTILLVPSANTISTYICMFFTDIKQIMNNIRSNIGPWRTPTAHSLGTD